jgi:hypothetical protein
MLWEMRADLHAATGELVAGFLGSVFGGIAGFTPGAGSARPTMPLVKKITAIGVEFHPELCNKVDCNGNTAKIGPPRGACEIFHKLPLRISPRGI